MAFMNNRPSVLRAAATDLVDETVGALRQRFESDGRPWHGLVVIVDSLDHARGIEGDVKSFSAVREALERLFTEQLEAIALPPCRFVYCLPPYARVSGARTVPHVKIRTREERTPWPPGREALRDILSRRAPEGVLDRFFDEDDQYRLIDASGGSLRDLFRLVQESLIQATSLPATLETVASAIRTVRLQFAGILAQDELRALAAVRRTRSLPLENQAEWVQLSPMFDRYLVLRYSNGGDWYDVHPLVVDLLPAADD
jgi:hypothetical protein